MSWWVGAIANQSAPSTANPYIFQAATRQDAINLLGGNPLAGPFSTQAQAQAWANGPGKSNFGAGKTNIAPPNDPSLLTNPKGGLGIPGLDIFNGLNLGSALMRIGEVALGVVLLAIALNALLKNPAGKAAKVAAVVK